MKLCRLFVKKLSELAKIPTKAEYGEDKQFGIDFYALESVLIEPRSMGFVRTGVAVQIINNITHQSLGLILKDKSGIACRKGLHCFAGVIDADYTGEILAGFFNMTDQPVVINAGDPCIQGIVVPIFSTDIIEVDHLEVTIRGDKGFGSSYMGGDVKSADIAGVDKEK